MEYWRTELCHNRQFELYHHGILGQKWGKRNGPPYPLGAGDHSASEKKAGWRKSLGDKVSVQVKKTRENEKEYRKKLKSIIKNRRANPNDVTRFKYRNHSLGHRVGTTAAAVTVQMLIADMLSGRISNYGSMSKKQLTRKLTEVAATTAVNVALKDSLAKSASKRYDNAGKRAKGVKDRFITKEDAIEMGVGTAVRAAPFLNIIMQMKMAQVYATRARNEREFNRWGQNILAEKVDNIVWQSDDDNMHVIG